MAIMNFSHIANAQVDWSSVFNKFSLEARADGEYFHHGFNSELIDGLEGDASITAPSLFDEYGMHGKYFNLLIGGNLNDQFSYYFRQRLVANNGSVNFFDNTDFLYLNYKMNKNWMFRLGKDALAVGGFEYDAPPIDVLFSTTYWDNFYCFQPALAAGYTTNNGKHLIMAQIGNSPYVHYDAGLGYSAGNEWKSGLLSYNLYWSGNFGHFKTLYSANLFQRENKNVEYRTGADGPDNMLYVALGHKLVYDNWDIYLDIINHSFAADDWAKNYAVISCFNYQVKPQLNIFVKGAYETNQSDYDIINLGGNSYDCFVEAGHSYCLYGAGFEYRPSKCPSVRLHGYVAQRNDMHNEIRTNTVDNTFKITESTLNVNFGITWNMDVLKLLKK